MRLTLTLKNCRTDSSYDIQMDSAQTIGMTMRVIYMDLPQAVEQIGDAYTLRSMRTGRRINVEKTYEEAGIYNGDSLLLNRQDGEMDG